MKTTSTLPITEQLTVTIYDSQPMPEMIDENDKAVCADSAYWEKTVAEVLPKHIKNCINERGTKKQSLTEEQGTSNNTKSKVRCRVEHVFEFMMKLMCEITVRSIEIKRAEFSIGLSNIIYNLFQFEFLHRSVVAAA